MELIIAELSRYIIVIIFALYTFYSYRAFIGRAAGNNEGVFRAQRVLTVMLHLVCSAVILVVYHRISNRPWHMEVGYLCHGYL